METKKCCIRLQLKPRLYNLDQVQNNLGTQVVLVRPWDSARRHSPGPGPALGPGSEARPRAGPGARLYNLGYPKQPA